MSDPASRRLIELTRQHESTAAHTFALRSDPPLFVRGDGPFLYASTGERYIDLIAGSAVTNLGHGLPGHKAAIARVLESGIIHTGARFAHVERAELYGALAEVLPPELPRIHLVSVGTEAVETALKAAQYASGRRRIFAFEGGYHGRTVGALSVTHAPKLHARFTVLRDVTTFIPFPYRFRSMPPAADGAALAASCLQRLEDALRGAKADRDLPSCVLLEAVQGTGGAIIPPKGFLKEVAALARHYGVLLIVDEIWTGFGRTGRWFAFQHDGIVPDMICFSKGLSAGLPLAGVAGGEDLLGKWPAGIHTSTFQGNPVACAMARATLAEMHAHGWVDHAAGPVARVFERHLSALRDRRRIRDVRWIGAAAAVEFCTDDLQPDVETRQLVQSRCFEAGLLVYGGGREGNTIILLPPINIDPSVLDEAVSAFISIIQDLHLR